MLSSYNQLKNTLRKLGQGLSFTNSFEHQCSHSLFSILMPASSCESLTCFCWKSIACVNPLLSYCITSYAMKASYEHKKLLDVSASCSFCSGCKKAYNIVCILNKNILSQHPLENCQMLLSLVVLLLTLRKTLTKCTLCCFILTVSEQVILRI